jgi:hypothetical protein
MSDENERSCALRGSGCCATSNVFRDEWAEAARNMTLFGVPLVELGRDDLMGVIGYLSQQVERERKFYRSTVDILKSKGDRRE